MKLALNVLYLLAVQPEICKRTFFLNFETFFLLKYVANEQTQRYHKGVAGLWEEDEGKGWIMGLRCFEYLNIYYTYK